MRTVRSFMWLGVLVSGSLLGIETSPAQAQSIAASTPVYTAPAPRYNYSAAAYAAPVPGYIYPTAAYAAPGSVAPAYAAPAPAYSSSTPSDTSPADYNNFYTHVLFGG